MASRHETRAAETPSEAIPKEGDREHDPSSNIAGVAPPSEDSRRDERFRILAEDFYQAVCSSKRFSWMGVFETKDELQRARLVVYLKEKARSSTKNPQRHGKANILPAFHELLFAFRPNAFLDLYYNRSDEYDPERLVEGSIEDIKLRYGSDGYKPKAELLWHEPLPE